MKHLYTFALSIAAGLLAAQTGLSNMDFENWTGGLPNGWDAALGGVTQKTSGAQHGNSYCELKTSATSPALLVLGSFGDNGVPYSSPVGQLTGFYRASGLSGTDFAGISVGVSKSGNSIGAGGLFITANKSAWTSFAAVVYTTQAGTPDTISITLTSPSGNSLTPGATMDVDNFALSTSVNLDEHSLGTRFLVFPNPASKQISITTPGGHFKFELITTDAKRVKQIFSENESLSVNLEGLPPGVYFYIATVDDSETVSGKLVIQ